MIKVALLLPIIFLILPLVYSEESVPLPVAYCEHQGYAIEINNNGSLDCRFNTENKCDSWNFWKGECGTEWKKERPLIRNEGESVYLEFEKCKEGLISSESKYVLEQPKCEKLIDSFFNSIINKIINFF